MAKLTTKQLDAIERLWNKTDEAEMSTEQVFARVCSAARAHMGIDIDDGDVAEAIDPLRRRGTR